MQNSMNDIMQRIKQLRENKGYSYQQLADLTGMSKSTLQRYETGDIKNIPLSKLSDLALALDVDPITIMGWEEETKDIFQYENIMPLPETKRIPLIGTIACRTPIFAEENMEGYVFSDIKMHTDFALRCDGDSMVNARINDGDIVYIRKQSDVNNGEIAAVLIENKATLKRVFKLGDHIELRAENPKYNPIIINKDDNIEVIILGKVISALIHFE